MAATGVLLRDLMAPRGCAGCDMPDEILCKACTQAFSHTVELDMPGTLAGYGAAAAPYHGVVRQAILQWKDHGDQECDMPLAYVMVRLVDTLRLHGLVQYAQCQQLLVVPAPSSPSSVHARGRRHLEPLAMCVSDHLQRHGVTSQYARALTMRRQRRKAVQTASAASRIDRLAGAIRFDPAAISALEPRKTMAVIIDDIITTGATMRQCVQTLDDAGIPVLTTLALARTPRD
ncbi:ComF family protein [Bifidobacterium gallicum]|uniref:ComF family protein n=1 Tax=Bifidobacterium gallicum TaxID=78342 RepID=UPI0011DCF7E1|nr:ComF family protein [Bifidobacterium gallicum]